MRTVIGTARLEVVQGEPAGCVAAPGAHAVDDTVRTGFRIRMHGRIQRQRAPDVNAGYQYNTYEYGVAAKPARGRRLPARIDFSLYIAEGVLLIHTYEH